VSYNITLGAARTACYRQKPLLQSGKRNLGKIFIAFHHFFCYNNIAKLDIYWGYSSGGGGGEASGNSQLRALPIGQDANLYA